MSTTASGLFFTSHANDRFRCRDITRDEAVAALGTGVIIDNHGIVTIPKVTDRAVAPGLPVRIGRQFFPDGTTRYVVLAYSEPDRPIHLVIGTRGKPAIVTAWDPTDPACDGIWHDHLALPTNQGRLELPPTIWDLEIHDARSQALAA